MPIDEDYLDDIAAAFAQVVDSKSPYTSGHSERVTLFADMREKGSCLRQHDPDQDEKTFDYMAITSPFAFYAGAPRKRV